MLSSSLSGINAASAQFSAAAGNIANLTTPDYSARRANLASTPDGGVAVAGASFTGSVDLATEFVAIIQARAAFTANVHALKAQNETLGTVLDLIS